MENAQKKVVAGRYVLGDMLGEGGMGAVYAATHIVSKKRVALKLLHPHITKDESSRARFLREASVSAQIGHEGIVEVYDAGFDEDGAPFVAMELLEGSTLSDRMESGPMSLPEIFSVFLRMLDPLAAAHARGIVHRDLKPDNVFIQRKASGAEVVKILDFGIARDLDAKNQNMTQTGVAMGTPHYMSPEQAMSAKSVVASADVWAVGAMLYEAVSGHVPFDGETSSAVVVYVCTVPHRPTLEAAPGIPPALAMLVDRCLAKDANARPPNASALMAELRAIADASGIVIPEFVGGGMAGGGLGRPTGAPHTGHSQPGFVPQHATPGASMPGHSQAAFAPPSMVQGSMPGHTPMPGPGYVPQTMPAQPGFAPVAAYAPPSGAQQPAYGGAPPSMTGMSQPATHGTWNAHAAPYPMPALPPPAKSNKGLVFGIVGGVVLACAIGGGLYSVFSSDDTATTTATVQPVVPTTPDTPAVPANPTGTSQRYTGSLGEGDRTLQSGEFMDAFDIAFQTGQRFRARAVADKLNTYLIVRSPSGKSHDNDDASRNDENAQLDIDVDEPGTWRVIVTSHRPGETGEYELTVEPR